MKLYAAAACIAALLTGSAALATGSSARDPGAAEASGGQTFVVETDETTGRQTTRLATPAEREQIRGYMDSIQPSLDALSDGTFAQAMSSMEHGLKALEGLDERLALLEEMVRTETPVSTTITDGVTVRVYRNGITVTDSDGSRSFQMND